MMHERKKGRIEGKNEGKNKVIDGFYDYFLV